MKAPPHAEKIAGSKLEDGRSRTTVTVMQRRQLLVLSSLWPLATSALADAAASVYEVRKLRDLADNVTSLEGEANHKSLVVVVMKGHWCGVCIAQLRRLGKAQSKLKKLSAQVVGLNTDSVRANRAMAETQNVPFQVLSDRSREVVKELGLWLEEQEHPMPALVVFDACGKEAARVVGRRPGERLEKDLFKLLARLKKDNSCSPPNA